MSALRDLRYALRRLAREPLANALLVLVLALGIGANSAIFSLVDALLFRALPVAEPESLMRVSWSAERGKGFTGGASYLQYQEKRAAMERGAPPRDATPRGASTGDATPRGAPPGDAITRGALPRDAMPRDGVFTGLAAFANGAEVDLSLGGGEPARAMATVVSGNYFGVLGVRPALGRLLDPDDDRVRDGSPVVVLSDGLWRRRFGADPAVVGASVRLNARSFTVVGVAPAGFRGVTFEEMPELWVPLSMTAAAMPNMVQFKPFERRGFSFLDLIGRLAPGVSMAQAQARFDSASERELAAQLPPDQRSPFVWASVRPAAAATLAQERRALVDRLSWILLAVAALVLAIACSVAAGLLLVRGERRQRELAVRLALGASRGRLVGELLLESCLIAAAAAVAGWLIAAWSLRAFALAAPAAFALPVAAASPVSDPRELLFTAGVTLLATVLFGLLPAMRGGRADLAPALKREIRGFARSGDRLRFSLRDVFVVVQVSLSALLLVGAGLLLRTLAKASAVDLGFDADHAVALRVDVARQGYGRDAGRQFYGRLLESVRALPGVTSAALGYHVPVQSTTAMTSLELTGFTPKKDEEPRVSFAPVSPAFFQTLRIPILRGRDFAPADDSGPPVVIVNQAFADRYWPGRDPLSERVLNFGERGAQVIGVVRTVRNTSVREADEPFLYVPTGQFYTAAMTLVARTAGDPQSLLPALRAALAALDPHLPPLGAGTLRERVGQALGQERVLAALLSAFGLVALALAALGLYAVMAYATEMRSREFGVRLALGARPGMLVRLVAARALTLAAVGAALGLATALVATRALAGLLFDVPPNDAMTFGAIAGLLLVVAALASALPAARAARLDAISVLRQE